MPRFNPLTVGGSKRISLCTIQSKRLHKVHRGSVCADLQQQLHLTLHSHHLTKHIYDDLRWTRSVINLCLYMLYTPVLLFSTTASESWLDSKAGLCILLFHTAAVLPKTQSSESVALSQSKPSIQQNCALKLPQSYFLLMPCIKALLCPTWLCVWFNIFTSWHG